ncbi:hypothetical protein N0V84_006071 [Fusarium piperis]|uniref:Pentatricopeptide repeat domain-containing protein n=1 Tax=Fusarium piperis TaxID=1435070 RepID=A0A9W8WCN0_9HYPO|nr:hypothetical protein N0V84_006071 [Fusarium piperis]
MEELFAFAQQLRDEYDFNWPELYMKVVHFYLGQSDYDAASRWHLKLMPVFRPELDSFGALLTSFVIDFSPEIQRTLTRMYVFSPFRELYDYVVPALLDSGQSHSARVWRKRFILFNDHPTSSKSKPFLDFASRYFPTMRLTQEELKLLGRDGSDQGALADSTTSKDSQSDQPKGIYSDKFTARWFASSWTSAEFAINLMHKLGLRTIGPLSLQSVALREDDARGVLDRLTQLEKLKIAVASNLYCKAIVSFAKGGNDDLLRDLLHCDIHPDEFDDAEKRQMLLAAAARQQDWERERLLQEVEALEVWTSQQRNSHSEELNKHLRAVLARKDLHNVRLVLDEMDTSNVSLEQRNSAALLHRVFKDIWYHPKTSKQKLHGYQGDPQLDRAIYLALRVARHDVAIPIRYWQMLLYNLGRLGRFSELEELSYEICELYNPEYGGLIPVHWRDLPPKPGTIPDKESEKTELLPEPSAEETGKGKRSHFPEEFWRAEMGLTEKELKGQSDKSKSDDETYDGWQKRTKKVEEVFCIPADLPFTHRQHPVQKIFDNSLQRAILRWGFDKTLAQEPTKLSLMKVKQAGAQDFDLAYGVRLLALLRDRGVFVDKQIVRSAIIKRIAVAQLPGRARARARDDRELSPASMKRLVDEAWGSEILPGVAQLSTELENQKPKMWKNYPRLFKKTYDKDGDDDDEEIRKAT